MNMTQNLAMDFKEFLLWEQASQDTIDVKKIYIDIAGDQLAGILLSQIMYWFLPSKKGGSKLRVIKDGVEWLAKGRNDWWDECRFSPKQFDRASKILESKNIIEKKTYKFDGDPTIHIRVNFDVFIQEWNYILHNQPENPYKKKSAEKAEKRRLEKEAQSEEESEQQLSMGDIVIPQKVKTSDTNDFRVDEDELQGKMVIPQRDKTSNDAVFTQRGITEFPFGEERNQPKGNLDINLSERSLTKNTTENTNIDMVGGKLGDDVAPAHQQNVNPDKNALMEFQMFQRWCTKNGEPDFSRARDFFKVWKNYYPECPLATTIAIMRDLIEDEYNGFTAKKNEFKNIAGLFHHRMKEWKSLHVMYTHDPVYEVYKNYNEDDYQ